MAYPALTCRNCLHAIVLPFPIPHGVAQKQMTWPADGKSRNIVCPNCGQAFAYYRENLWEYPPQGETRAPVQPEREVHVTSVPCPRKGCGGLIEICTVVPKDSPVGVGERAARASTETDICCTNGHSHVGNPFAHATESRLVETVIASTWS